MYRALLAALSLLVSGINAQATAITILIPPVVPITAQVVTSFPIGLSVEQDRFPDWGGHLDSPNNYTHTLLSNIRDRAGTPPPIRVGGTTEDRTWLSPNASLKYYNDTFPPSTNSTTKGLYPEATIVYAGSDFWNTAATFPNGTEFTFGLNLRALDPEMAAQVAVKAWEAVKGKGVKLRAFEIGNEVDLYGNWSVKDYATNWNTYAQAVLNASHPYSPPTFQLFAYGNPNNSTNFTVSGALKAGIANATQIRNLTKIASEHHYQGNPKVVSDLMNHSSVAGNIAFFSTEIAAARAANLSFELGETGSVGGHGQPGVSNVAGAAVWAVDYVFQALSKGIKRIYFHNGVCYRYNLFQPVANCSDDTLIAPPHIMPMYHVLPITAETLSHSGPVKVAELEVQAKPANETGVVSAYGVWAADSGELLRAVIVNSAAYYSNTTAPRKAYNYTLSSLPTSPSTFSGGVGGNSTGSTPFARRLFLPGVERYNNLTWAGQSFETLSGRPEGKRVDEPVQGGVIPGRESEVVVVYWKEG